MAKPASTQGLYATLAVVSTVTVALAALLFESGSAIRPSRRTAFEFDEPPPATGAATNAP